MITFAKSYTNHMSDKKAEWGGGPWDSEPDKAQWVDEATGLDCLIVRNHGGALCGYVGIPKEHPFYGQDYDNHYDLHVHGGLTYANSCNEREDPAEGICHVPLAGRTPDIWWFGFDTAHLGDVSPAYDRHHIHGVVAGSWGDETYKPVEYVVGECERLASQLAAAG